MKLKEDYKYLIPRVSGRRLLRALDQVVPYVFLAPLMALLSQLCHWRLPWVLRHPPH